MASGTWFADGCCGSQPPKRQRAKEAYLAAGDVHTVHKNGTWLNEIEGGKELPLRFVTKEGAEAAGRREAVQRKTEHLIHKKDGTIGERNSYGNDPASRPG